MITTVCMNPSFDKTASVERLLPGETNLLSDIRYDVGGKGINVAYTLKRLGAEVSCVGCLGEEDASKFAGMLSHTGIPFHYSLLPGKVRTNLKLLESHTGKITELNEPGPEMDALQLKSFLDMLEAKAKSSRYVVLSGKLPPGSPADTYSRCMQRLPNACVLLDTAGEALASGIQAKPFLVKPNLPELEAVTRRELHSLTLVREAATVLIEKGAQNVIVSMGKEGALFTDGRRTFYSPALAVEAKSTVGAGDAMLGGVLYGLSKGEDLHAAFRYGVAAGAASVMSYGTQPLSQFDFNALLPIVTEREI